MRAVGTFLLGIIAGVWLFNLSSEKMEELDSIYLMIRACGIKNPKVVLAQMIHETGVWKSDILKENSNPFGMKCAMQRETLCQGTNRGHGKFKSFGHALVDYEMWQSKYYPTDRALSDKEYIEFLVNQGYAEDSAYRSKVDQWYRVLNLVL